MRKSLLAIFLSVIMLVGCESPQKVVPVVEKFNPSEVLSKPPAHAMIPPSDPTPLPYGADNAKNIAIVKKNNLEAADTRSKLLILQAYIRNIFTPQK
mgnify:CR=1 FL=1|jgi:uncharacterized protein YcfL